MTSTMTSLPIHPGRIGDVEYLPEGGRKYRLTCDIAECNFLCILWGGDDDDSYWTDGLMEHESHVPSDITAVYGEGHV